MPFHLKKKSLEKRLALTIERLDTAEKRLEAPNLHNLEERCIEAFRILEQRLAALERHQSLSTAENQPIVEGLSKMLDEQSSKILQLEEKLKTQERVCFEIFDFAKSSKEQFAIINAQLANIAESIGSSASVAPRNLIEEVEASSVDLPGEEPAAIAGKRPLEPGMDITPMKPPLSKPRANGSTPALTDKADVTKNNPKKANSKPTAHPQQSKRGGPGL